MLSRRRPLPPAAVLITLLISTLLGGCSIKHVALVAVADSLSEGTGGTFSQDEDLIFVGQALPFALKLMEGIDAGVPEHIGMKLTLASGFTQYGVVFVEWPAEQLKYDDYASYRAGLVRARGFYLRANRYAMRGMQLKHPGFETKIYSDTAAALNEVGLDDVPMMYWLAASWMAAALTDLEDPEMFGIFPIATAVMKKAYALDPDWNDAAIRELLISLEPVLPEPGGAERSREHFERCVEVQGGRMAGPYVAYASAVALKAQDKNTFVDLLNKALAIDASASPEDRLANDYAQQKARFLLDHLDDLFL